MNEELLPCPFCGGEAEFKSSIFNGDDKKSLGNIHCCKCYASTGADLQFYEQSIINWNTRSTPEVSVEEVGSILGSDNCVYGCGYNEQCLCDSCYCAREKAQAIVDYIKKDGNND